MPRTVTKELPAFCVSTRVMLGTRAMKSRGLSIPADWIVCSVSTFTVIGTFWNDSSRLRAVTTTSVSSSVSANATPVVSSTSMIPTAIAILPEFVVCTLTPPLLSSNSTNRSAKPSSFNGPSITAAERLPDRGTLLIQQRSRANALRALAGKLHRWTHRVVPRVRAFDGHDEAEMLHLRILHDLLDRIDRGVRHIARAQPLLPMSQVVFCEPCHQLLAQCGMIVDSRQACTEPRI